MSSRGQASNKRGEHHHRIKRQIGEFCRRIPQQRQPGQGAHAGGQRADPNARPPGESIAPRGGLDQNIQNTAGSTPALTAGSR